jgi:hypothetical protein
MLFFPHEGPKMYERAIVLLLTSASGILHAYWLFWAFALITTRTESRLAAALERENERLHLLFGESMSAGTLLLQWLDWRMMTMWFSVNRPFGPMADEGSEDLISKLGRFDHFRQPRRWALQSERSTLVHAH